MIQIQNISKRFGKKQAVNNISLEVKQGEIFGFLGPNGAGKSTTIKMLVGLLLPDEGTVHIAGVDAVKSSLESKKKLAYVPDNPEVYENMTGRQFAYFIANVFGVSKEDRIARVNEYAALFGLDKDIDAYISSYSHGMKQKIALIAALVHDPEVLILDEPMVGLDPKSAFTLKEIMRKRCTEGKAVFFSTHVMEVAEKICDRIAIINHGEIIAMGTMDEIKEHAQGSQSLEQIFLELTE